MSGLAGTSFDATFRVYRPDGSLLCEATRTNPGLIEQVCTIDVTGGHAIVLSDDNGVDTGNYSVALQRLNGPDQAIPISYGETLAGTIDPAGEIDTYVFDAVAGDLALVRMSGLAGSSFDATFRVYRPDGSLLCEATRTDPGLIEQVCTIDVTGGHAIVLSDDNGVDTGNYSVALQRLNGPAQAIPISYGETLAGAIDPAGEIDTYVFDAMAGDVALVRMSGLAGTFDATFRVYRPDGSLLCEATRTNLGLIEQVCTIDVTGSHAIISSDDNGVDIGNYSVALQRLNGPGQAIPISYGETFAGAIDPAGEIDTYVFDAVAGDVALVRMSGLAGTSFDATFRVYRPDGSLLCEATRTNPGLIEQVCTVDVTGSHAIILSDDNGVDTGDYELTLEFQP